MEGEMGRRVVMLNEMISLHVHCIALVLMVTCYFDALSKRSD